MNAHTPGPWHAFDDEIVASNTDEHIATVDARGLGMNPTEWQANLRLIAAAPELLAACKLALGAFERNDAIDWNELAVAIAKAEGR